MYGPWSPGIDQSERRAQLRGLASIAAVYLSSAHPLVEMLRDAEHDERRLNAAFDMFEALHAKTRRQMLSTHAAVTGPRRPQRPRRLSRDDLDQAEPVGDLREGGA
jgi:hypothetical protein